MSANALNRHSFEGHKRTRTLRLGFLAATNLLFVELYRILIRKGH